MLRVSTLSADAGLHDQNEMETTISQLKNEGYSPIVRSMLAGGVNAVKLPSPGDSMILKMLDTLEKKREYGPTVVVGEVFFKDGIVYTLNSNYESIFISIAGLEQENNFINKFGTDVEKTITDNIDRRRLRGMQFNWKSSSYFIRNSSYRYSTADFNYSFSSSPRGDELKFQIPSYNEDDIKAANFLSNEKVREFLIRLAKLTKMTEKDVEQELTTKDSINEFIMLGLVAEEYLLTCKQDQHTICFLSSRDQLMKESTSSIRCTTCGRAFPEENVKEIFTITEKGRNLVHGSRWMSIWITELLAKNGIKKDTIRWQLEGNGDELDVLVQDFNSRVFLELKDREFGIGDAYPFAYRINRYGGTLGAIVTTSKVAQDARKFLGEERKRGTIRISYLEGNQGIEEGIKHMIKELSMIQIRKLINPISELVGFSLFPIIESWAQRKLFENSRTISQT